MRGVTYCGTCRHMAVIGWRGNFQFFSLDGRCSMAITNCNFIGVVLFLDNLILLFKIKDIYSNRFWKASQNVKSCFLSIGSIASKQLLSTWINLHFCSFIQHVLMFFYKFQLPKKFLFLSKKNKIWQIFCTIFFLTLIKKVREWFMNPMTSWLCSAPHLRQDELWREVGREIISLNEIFFCFPKKAIPFCNPGAEKK